MALSPAEMDAAILRNLSATTGDDLAGWAARLADAQLTHRREQQAWLKSQGVGHVTAQVIVRHLGDPADPAARHAPEVHALAASIREATGGQIVVCAGYIGVRDPRQYAVVTAKRDGVHLGLALGEATAGEIAALDGIVETRGLGGGRITHRLVLDTGGAALDARARAAVELAHRVGA